MTADAPRVAPGTRRDVGLVNWSIAAALGRAAGTSPPNVFLTLGRHRGLFRGWLHFAGRLMPFGRLSRRETELVILRVAYLAGCTYEQSHHRPLAIKAGVSPAEVDRVLTPAGDGGWSPRERVILTTVDLLHEHRDLTDEQWATLRQHLSEREAIELLLLAGHYEMLATTINTLRIPLDEPRG